MIDKICMFLTNKIRKEMPEIDDERAEVINYGLQNIIGEIPKIFITLGIAYLLGIFKLTLITFLVIMPYRSFSGGFHLKTHLGCIICTTIFYCGIAFASKYIVLEQTISGVLQGLGKVIVPAIALTVGVVIKLILNLILIKIDPNVFILGGINGATVSTVICHMVAVIIDYAVLRKTIKLKLELSTFVIKPLMATIIMIIGAIYTYNKCLSIFSDKLSIILAIGFAVLIYGIFIIVFKILDKDNIKMIPFGKKILEILNLEKQ